MTNSSKAKIKTKNNVLIDMIKNDQKLEKDQKMSYISLANLYLEKFDEYIDKTSIDINKDVPLGVDTWRDFLNYPVVRKYIQSFKDERIMQVADKGLMEGDKGAIGIKKIMQENGPIVNNSNIVLIRIPEKVDWD